jgi:hypothetical protein
LFGIAFTMVEPGPARTSFGTGLVTAPPMREYENTPSGEIRRAIASGSFAVNGDDGNMVDAMIACADRDPAPRRLTLGSDAYAWVRAALVDRLAALDAQKQIAFVTDRDAERRAP